MDIRSSHLLLCLLVLLLGSRPACCQCPDVQACIKTFTDSVSGAGHDQEVYCREKGLVIECIKKATCSPDTKSNKDNELKHFQTDRHCDSASAIVAGLHILLVSTLCLMMNLLYR
ncbi:hypothetical protein BsWGS_03145 [Bradybaena similaris]